MVVYVSYCEQKTHFLRSSSSSAPAFNISSSVGFRKRSGKPSRKSHTDVSCWSISRPTTVPPIDPNTSVGLLSSISVSTWRPTQVNRWTLRWCLMVHLIILLLDIYGHNVTRLKDCEQRGRSESTWFRVSKDASRTVSLELQKCIKPCVKRSWVLADVLMAVMEKLHKDFFKMLTDSQTDSIAYNKEK